MLSSSHIRNRQIINSTVSKDFGFWTVLIWHIGCTQKTQTPAVTYLAEIIAKAIALLTWTLPANKQALRISLHKQLDAGLNKQRQVCAGHLHHPVPGASATQDCASSTCQGPVCTSPAPGLSCLCSRAGLTVLGCNWVQTGKPGPALLLLRSGAEAETLGLGSCPGCVEGRHVPGLVPPCPTDLLAWPQTCCYGLSWQLGAWLRLVTLIAPALLAMLADCGPAGAGTALPALGRVPAASSPPRGSACPCCSLAPQASEQPYSLLTKGSETQEKGFLIIFYLGQTNIFDCFGWAEAPSYFYAYADLA